MKRPLAKLTKFPVNRIIPVLTVCAVAFVGIYLLSASHAASPYGNSEAEAGTLAGGAIAKTDSTASGGSYVQFGSSSSSGSGSFADSFVKTNGTNFTLATKPFKFVGFNILDAAASDFYQCAWWPRWTDAELNAAMAYMHNVAGVTVLRVWMYQTYTQGGTNWTGTDKMISIAKANGLKLIVNLEDGPGYCTTGPAGQAKWQYQGDTWYTQGYKVPYGTATMSYRDYAPLVAAHYKNEPTIMAWDLVNEPDTSAKNAAGQSVDVDFLRDMSTLVKAADPNHLISYGGQSNGSSGTTGSDYIADNELPDIDFGEIHDYFYQDPDSTPLPGSSDGKTLPDPNSSTCLQQYSGSGGMVACSIAQAMQVVHKPVIFGEDGIGAAPGDTNAHQLRAQEFDAKMNAAFTDGVSGYVIWQFNKVVDTGTVPFDVLQSSPDDPVIPVVDKYAKQLNTADGTNW